MSGRDGVRERGEHGGDEHEPEHGQRSTHDVRGPAATRGHAGERDEQQRGDGDRAGAAQHLRGEMEPLRRLDDELARVLLQRARPLLGIGAHRGGVSDDREQPREEQPRGQDERPERDPAGPSVSPSPRPADEQEPPERHPEKERVGRVHDGERKRGSGGRRDDRAGRRPHAGERQRERRGREHLA